MYKDANNLNIVDKDGNISINNKIEEKNTLINSIKEEIRVLNEEISIINDKIKQIS